MLRRSTVTTKGQVTIPHGLRQQYGIAEGTQVVFTAIDSQTIMLTVVPPLSTMGYGVEDKGRIPCRVVGAKITR